MPRKKKEEEVREDVREDIREEVADEQDTDAELTQFLAENAETANFATVYRKAPNGQFERIGKFALSSCDLDSIASEYGGGVFRVRITTESGQFLRQFTTTYAVPVKKDKPAPQNDSNAIVNMLISQNQQNATMLLKAIEVLGTRQPSGGDTLKPSDIISLLSAMKNLSSGGAAEELLKGLELGMTLGEKTSGNVSTIDRIVEALPNLATALQTRKAMIREQVKTAVQKPAMQSIPEKTEVVTPSTPLETKIFALFSGVRPHVQTAEKNNLPAGMVVSYLVNSIDDETARDLREYLCEQDEQGAPRNYARLAKFLGIREEYLTELAVQFLSLTEPDVETVSG